MNGVFGLRGSYSMVDIKTHPFQKWEVSIMEIKEGDLLKYKVTRRLPEMAVAETKIFSSKEEALRQVNEWLS